MSELPRPRIVGQERAELRSAAVSGIFWAFGQKLGARLVSFVVFALLGRLLAPDDFGTVAVAAAFGAYAGLLVDFGLPLFVIQRSTITPRDRDTIVWLGLGLSLIAALTQFAAADLVAGIIGEPGVAEVLRVMAFLYPVASIAGIQIALFKRQLRFRSIAIRGLLAALVSGLVAVGLALQGAGVWALVSQAIVFQAASVVILWATAPWFPRFVWERGTASTALAFGGKALGSFLLDTVAGTADVLIIGRQLGIAVTGQYSVANRVSKVAVDSVVGVVYAVANPIFAKARQSEGLVGAAYSRAVTQAVLVSAPILGVAAALFGPIVVLVLGSKWMPATAVGSLLVVAEAVRVPIWLDKSLMYALGRPGRELVLATSDTVLLVAAVAVGSQWGLVGVGWGLVARAVIMWPVRLAVSSWMVGVGPWSLGWRVVRIWLAAASASAASWLTLNWTAESPAVLQLVLGGFAGLGAYAFAISAIARKDALYTLSLARNRWRQRRGWRV